jgi:hypothetical protein
VATGSGLSITATRTHRGFGKKGRIERQLCGAQRVLQGPSIAIFPLTGLRPNWGRTWFWRFWRSRASDCKERKP